MVRRDLTLFDDPFDSPIVSPISYPNSSLLNTVPGSALAERILNDPAAWEVLGENLERQADGQLLSSEMEIQEELMWLEEEIKRLSVHLTPTTPYNFDTALPEEDDPIPLSPSHSSIVKATPGHQDPKSVQQDKFRASPKLVFPAYVHDPPGGLDVPRQGFTERLPGLDGDDMIHLFASEFGSHDSFSADLHIRLSHVLGGGSGATGTTIEAASEPSVALSPPSSDSSSSSSSSPRRGLHSTERSCSPVPPNSALPLPSSATTSVISPFYVNSASATLSFLEWNGIQANTPLGSATISQVCGTGTGISPSTPHIDTPSQTSLVATVDSDALRNELGEHSTDVPELITRTDANLPSGGEDKSVLPLRIITNEGIIASTPLLRKRCGIICETPSDGKPSMAFLQARGSPKPPPSIPLPDIPDDEPPPPPVPPKDYIMPSRTEVVGIRRLPTIPTTSVASNSEFNINGDLSPMVYTPPPQPPHTSTHISHRPFRADIPYPATRPLMIPPRPADNTDSPGSSSTVLSTAGPSTARSPPCPAGPRRRGFNNNTTPIKSRHATARVNGNESVMSLVNISTNSPTPAVTVLRSVSAPRGLPRHVYSKSE